MNNKKILILSTAYYPLIGGAEVAIKEITDRIEDIEFDLLTARMDKNLPKNEKIGNVNVISPPGGNAVQMARKPNIGTITHCNGVTNSEYAGNFTIFLKYLL